MATTLFSLYLYPKNPKLYAKRVQVTKLTFFSLFRTCWTWLNYGTNRSWFPKHSLDYTPKFAFQWKIRKNQMFFSISIHFQTCVWQCVCPPAIHTPFIYSLKAKNMHKAFTSYTKSLKGSWFLSYMTANSVLFFSSLFLCVCVCII